MLHVEDQDGNPVPGVAVNFCTDAACTMQQSDENGVITFDVDGGEKQSIENPSPALPSREGVKILRDGKLYIMYKGTMYDVQGRRI